MQLNPYLYFNGRCEEAFQFYEQRLGGRITAMITHAGTPAEAHVPAEWRNKIMHARLTLGDSVLMGTDNQPEHYQEAKGFSVQLGVEDPLDADRLFNALAENGTVRMPIQKTFWAVRFGMLVDQFGIPWMINCEGASAG
ncbi:MAG: VOC family protein [Acidobacteriia bacterium]|nr:VOC family protein [Terriglobia bacterium]